MDIKTLHRTVTPDEVVMGVGGVWYAAYRKEATVLTNVSGRITRYSYVDAEDLESAMRVIRRYRKPEAPSNKGHEIIDAFFRAEGEVSE